MVQLARLPDAFAEPLRVCRRDRRVGYAARGTAPFAESSRASASPGGMPPTRPSDGSMPASTQRSATAGGLPAPTNAVMRAAGASIWRPPAQRLLESIERQSGMRGARHPPADDPSGEVPTTEVSRTEHRQVATRTKSYTRRMFGRGATNSTCTRSLRHGASRPGTVVLASFPRATPFGPVGCIGRAAARLATPSLRGPVVSDRPRALDPEFRTRPGRTSVGNILSLRDAT